MRRRDFIAGIAGSAASWPLAVRAQHSERVRRIGVLMSGPATNAITQAYAAAFTQALRQLGWIEGQNLRMDIRWNNGDAALAQTYARQLLALQPEAILAATTPNLEAVRQATINIPVVFTQVSDPVAQGFVASLTRPGGNLTGFGAYEFSIGSKWLELLKEIAPGLAHAAVMFNPDTSPQSKYFVRAIEAAALSRGVRATVVPVRATADIEPAITSLAREPNAGLILPTDVFTRLRQKPIAELAERLRLPAISWDPEFPRMGGLMCYSVAVNTLDQFRQAAGYVDRILKGTKPGDLPVQQAVKYSLVINLKTAKTLGLTLPLAMLGLADEVVE